MKQIMETAVQDAIKSLRDRVRLLEQRKQAVSAQRAAFYPVTPVIQLAQETLGPATVTRTYPVPTSIPALATALALRGVLTSEANGRYLIFNQSNGSTNPTLLRLSRPYDTQSDGHVIYPLLQRRVTIQTSGVGPYTFFIYILGYWE